MIKGISKQIIEIKCPNNEYFEKVLLFVNSKSNFQNEEFLRKQAKAFSEEITERNVPPMIKKKEVSCGVKKYPTGLLISLLSGAMIILFVILALLVL